MPPIVQKYGGTSVGSAERIRNVARRILETQQAGNQVVAIVSAMGGVTNKLIQLADDVTEGKGHTAREMDVLLSTGEQTTIALVSMAINAMGGKACSMTGRQAGFLTDTFHTKARIDKIDPTRVQDQLADGNIVIVAGFQGTTTDGRITTLGRGGSDLSAIAMAAALKSDQCQIFTDVDGVYTCDPRVVKNATKIDTIAYDELLEMASSGTKVMQSRSVEFAKKHGVEFEVRSSLNNNPGTLVKDEDKSMEAVVVRGVSLERDQAKVTIAGLDDIPGVASKVFAPLAENQIIIDMIVQNVSATQDSGVTDISFTVNKAELDAAKAALEPVLPELGENAYLRARDGIAKLSAVGIGMRSHSGVAAKMFQTLAEAEVNIQMISTSEIKTAVIIAEEDIERAAQTVHDAFGLDGAPKDETR